MMKTVKKTGQKGFTLVEVIVVAVIVAALAGVAVPVYIGYVNNSKLNTATNTAGAVASFMGSCKNSTGNTLAAYPAQFQAAPFSVTGAGNGTPIVCDLPNTANDPSILIPAGVTVELVGAAPNVAGAAIRGQHSDNTADWSPSYSY